MLCAGCGEPMTTGSKRGRPARYHGATCRQRARRTRLTTHHDAALSTLASLETAVSELRHAILTNKDTTEAHSRITAAAAELAEQLQPVHHSPTSPAADKPVTKYVTIPQTASAPDSAIAPGQAVAHPTKSSVPEPSEPSTADAACTKVVKTVDMQDSIGAAWTLVQHDSDTDASIWHVCHHGHTIGTVRRSYDLSTNARGWEARSPTTTTSPQSAHSPPAAATTAYGAPATAPPPASLFAPTQG